MDKIFGTPTEPLFNEKIYGISPDILQEWLKALASLNSKNVESSLKHEVKYINDMSYCLFHKPDSNSKNVE